MQTQVTNIEQSKTYGVYQELKGAGFNVELVQSFDFSYDKDNRFLSIIVENCENRLAELWEIAHHFEVVLAKCHKGSYSFIGMKVRQQRAFAEFVSDAVWSEFYSEAQ